MSTKTNFKRVALVAVASLGLGVLTSVAPANATAGDGVISATTGSAGLVSDITAGTTTRTAVLLSTGTLVLTLTGDSSVKVSGALITASGGAINGSQTCAAADVSEGKVQIKPTVAAGSTFTVTTYDETTCATAATIANVLTVTVAASNLAGVADPAESVVRWDADAMSGTAPTAAQDVTNSKTTFGEELELYISLADTYGNPITAQDGALVVTVTSGAYLGAISASAVVPTGTTTTQVSTADPSALWVVVDEATTGAGWAGTVTVTYNGVLIATKSGTITGAPASITVTPYKIASTVAAGSPDPAFLYTVKDAAGTSLTFTSTDLALFSSSNKAVVTDADGGSQNATSSSPYGSNVGAGVITCTTTAGTSDVVVSYTLANGTVIKSNSFKATCGGNAYNYTASFDKASYTQGEIATMTITFRDSKGNLANSNVAVDAATTASVSDATLSTPMMTLVGSLGAGATIKPNGAGQAVYKFTVGTATGLTDGAYNAVVNFPTLSLADPVSVAYKVGTGSTGVSNADVLKAIVSLIASINKQIAALQKALLKR
jgi:hypothetical protein